MFTSRRNKNTRPWTTVHNLSDTLHFSSILTVYERAHPYLPNHHSIVNVGSFFELIVSRAPCACCENII